MHNKKLLKKPLAVCLATGLLIASLDIYVLLKTFVISEVQAVVVKNTGSDIVQAAENTGTANTSSNTTANDTENTGTTTTVENGSTNNSAVTATESSESERTVTDSSYKDSNVDINITTVRKNNTTVYVADIKLSDSSYLKTALAYDSFGTNVTETTSSMATNNNTILAVNGDYYGADRSGYVIKNGVITEIQ